MSNDISDNLPGSPELPAAPREPLRLPRLRGARAYGALWPMLALLLAEALAIAALAAPSWPASPLALAGALAVLVAGLLPALLRPSAVTNLMGCSAVALASVIWLAPRAFGSLASFDQLAQALALSEVRLSLLNTVLLAPLVLHLSALFPRRGTLTAGSIAGYYLLVLGLALLTFALPLPWRQVGLIALLLASYAGYGLAGYQFLRTIRLVQPTEPRAAQQARLLLLSLVVAELPFLLAPVSQLMRLYLPYELVIGAQVLFPSAIAYTLLRHDLFRVDAALRRALDYALVSFGLLVIYFGLTTLLTQLSRDLGGRWGLAATVLSVIAASAAFTPLRRLSERVIDRAFYPERLRFGQTLSAARVRLSQVVQREAVIRLLEHELPQQLGARWARLVLRPAFEQPAAAGEPGAWSVLLTVGGQPIGCYWLGPRRLGLGYAADEQEQLQSLTQQAALALAYAEAFDSLVQLNDELEQRVAIRTDHVLAQQRELAAFEERQRLARDLHDSLKQTLFSLGIGLRAVRGRVSSDPTAAVRLLEQHEQSAIQAQAELGDLLAHLRTPAAGTADLVVLLADHAAWLAQQHGLAVALQLPPALVLPEPLPRELAQVAREALHNVLRHSGAGQASLSLASDQGQLQLTIRDQGAGFEPAAPSRGYGLRSMRERVALIGGTLDIQTAPGEGTTVWVQLTLKG